MKTYLRPHVPTRRARRVAAAVLAAALLAAVAAAQGPIPVWDMQAISEAIAIYKQLQEIYDKVWAIRKFIGQVKASLTEGWPCESQDPLCEAARSIFRSVFRDVRPGEPDFIREALRDLFDAQADVVRRYVDAHVRLFDQTFEVIRCLIAEDECPGGDEAYLKNLLGLFRLRGLLPERSLRLPRDVPSDDFPYDESVYDLTRTATEYIKAMRVRATTERDMTTIQEIEEKFSDKISDGSATVEERELLTAYADIASARSEAQAADMLQALVARTVERRLADAAFSRARHGADSAYGHALGLLVEAGRGATDTEKKP